MPPVVALVLSVTILLLVLSGVFCTIMSLSIYLNKKNEYAATIKDKTDCRQRPKTKETQPKTYNTYLSI